MNNITLKFLGTGYGNCNQVDVKIYDKNNNLIYYGNSFNGIIKLCLKKNSVYLIKATSLNNVLITTFYVDNCEYFIFDLNYRIITFQLTDYNYDNLPIMKGEILLV